MMDRPAALTRLEGDEALLAELIALFLRDTPALLATIREASAKKDAQRLLRAAHTLKGSTQELCIHAMTVAAQQIEDLGRASQWAALSDAVADLECRLADLFTRLASFEAPPNTGRSPSVHDDAGNGTPT